MNGIHEERGVWSARTGSAVGLKGKKLRESDTVST